MTLSKSDYMLFLKHPAWLWLKKHDKSKLPLVDENQQAIFDQGHLFEEYAEQLFPDSEKLGFENYEEYKNLPLLTKNALDNGVKTIFQGRFEYGELTCIVDVLKKINENEYELYEIKSSTSVKPEHIEDLSFQKYILEKLGMKVSKCFVIYVNTEYTRNGEVKCEEITKIENVSDAVEELRHSTEENISEALKVMKSSAPPDFSPKFSKSGFREWLDVYRFLNPNLEKYSIYYLTGISAELIEEFDNRGIKLINEIPDDIDLTDKQKHQIKAVKSGEQFIDKEEIDNFMEKIKYPLYFLDYETLSGVIPDFDGTHPYQQIPFQYSIHIINEPGGDLIHKEYLHRDVTHPCVDLLKHLKEDIGEEGTVLVWYEAFEKGRNSEMAEMFPEYKDFLNSLNERVVDLMIPFKNNWFIDRDFFGSASIKNVMPVLVKDLSYKILGIQEGATAQRAWMDVVLRGKNPEMKEKVLNDLVEYCKMDTLAMVKIFEVLSRR